MSASTKKKLRKEQNFAQLTEKQLTEQKEAKKLKITTIIFSVVILAVLVVGIVSMSINAYNNSGFVARNTTALVIGEHKLSAAELNYFYMDGINSFYNEWYEYYGDYASTYLMFMAGLDVSTPLDQQMYDENTTFADYFTNAAVNSAVSAYTAYDLAKAAGTDLHALDEESIDLSMSQIALAALQRGYTNTEDYLKALYGNGASEESFRTYLEVIAVSNHHMEDIFNSFTYEAADLDAYNAEHFEEFTSYSYRTFTVYPSNFLLCTAKEGEENHVHSDAENAQALNDAKAAAEAILAAAPTDTESFNEAIKALEAYAESTSTCSVVDDLLFSEITNEKMASWLKEEGRKAGDMTIITNETTSTDDSGKETTKVGSYTVVLMMGRNENNMELVNVRHILKSYEGGTTDSYGTTTYTDAEKQAAVAAIKLLEENYKGAGATEELFATLAKDNSTDTGSASNGGLYENVYPGQMVDEFNDWCFDAARKPGDTGIVETTYGAHLIYFVGTTGTTFRNYMIENTLSNEDYNNFVTEMNENADYQVKNTSKLNRDLIIGSMG